MTHNEACQRLRDITEEAGVWSSALFMAREKIREVIRAGCDGLDADHEAIAILEELLLVGFDNECTYARQYFRECNEGVADCESSDVPGFEELDAWIAHERVREVERSARAAQQWADKAMAALRRKAA
jgi:hypothetical protein